MIDLSLPLIGPALHIGKVLRANLRQRPTLAALLHGTPGGAKSHVLDQLALEITGSPHAIEQVNGQSLTVDLVRQWRQGMAYGNLFSKWTIKRIDEFDAASPAARNEVLSLLDYLKPHHLILASTNDYEKLRAEANRRLESRFKCYEVNGPSAEEAAAYLVQHFQIPADIAAEICEGAKPDGQMDMMADDPGVNMRLCVESAQSWLAAQEVEQELAAAA